MNTLAIRSPLFATQLPTTLRYFAQSSCLVDLPKRIQAYHSRRRVAMSVLPQEIEQVVKGIHKSDLKAVVYVAGGGVQVLWWLLAVPGASNTVLETAVPYSKSSMVDLIGKEPEKFSSVESAEQMARAAYQRAANLSQFGDRIVGLAATAALSTAEPRKGAHRVHIAAHEGARTSVYSLIMQKGLRSRLQEDEVASQLVLQALADVAEVPCDLVAVPLEEGEGLEEEKAKVSKKVLEDPLLALTKQEIRCVEYYADRVVVDAPRRQKLYLSGSFNPLHDGHRGMLEASAKACGFGPKDGGFELSIGNPDKGYLEIEEVKARVAQFTSPAESLPLIVTSAPLFSQKATMLPGSTFAVGYDTAVRLLDPKYYGGVRAMLLQLDKLQTLGCVFLVSGRKQQKGDGYQTLKDIEVPPELKDLFKELPESSFRLDISSTELRQQAAKKQER